MDEESHFDLVYKYSLGKIPAHGVEKISPAAAELIVPYKTTEYLLKPQWYQSGEFPQPTYAIPDYKQNPLVINALSIWKNNDNHEAGSFPVYYALAGLWLAAGRLFGAEEINLLYWIRFLNVPLFVVLILVSYILSRSLFPDNVFKRLLLPLCLVFFPQDAFYSINNDALSPVLFVVSFFMLTCVYFEKKSLLYHFLTGLFIAAACLTKVPNVLILPVFSFIVFFKAKCLLAEKQLKSFYSLLVLIAAAAIPISLWLARNYIVIGDITASSEKIKLLGWTVKPWSEFWNHPVFTVAGLSYFFKELTASFWRGEFSWHFDTMAQPWMDLFYVISSAVFISASAVNLGLNKNKMSKRYLFVLRSSFGMVISSVLLLVILSMLYDFHDCFYPSRSLPYFVSGRLILAVLVPFLIIYLDGLVSITSVISRNAYLPFIVTLFIFVVITCSELLLTLDVFKSPYNWFNIK